MLTLPHHLATGVAFCHASSLYVPERIQGPRTDMVWKADARECMGTPFLCEDTGMQKRDLWKPAPHVANTPSAFVLLRDGADLADFMASICGRLGDSDQQVS